LIIEEKPSGLIWVVFALGVLLFAALFVGSVPPTTFKRGVLAVMSLVFGAFCGLLAIFSYRKRNDGKRFYEDRVEVLRNYLKSGLFYCP